MKMLLMKLILLAILLATGSLSLAGCSQQATPTSTATPTSATSWLADVTTRNYVNSGGVNVDITLISGPPSKVEIENNNSSGSIRLKMVCFLEDTMAKRVCVDSKTLIKGWEEITLEFPFTTHKGRADCVAVYLTGVPDDESPAFCNYKAHG